MKVVIFECPVMKVAVFGLLLFEKGDSVILEFYTANRKVKDNVGHGIKEETPQSPAASPLERAIADNTDLTLFRLNKL